MSVFGVCGAIKTAYEVSKTAFTPSTLMDKADDTLWCLAHANQPTWKTGFGYAAHRLQREWSQVPASINSLKRTIQDSF